MSDRPWVVWSPPSLGQRSPNHQCVPCETDVVRITDAIEFDDDKVAEICRRHGIRRMGLFGSALTGEFGPDSDIDLLVEFEPDRVPGLLGVASLELELEGLLGRRVDVRTAADLSRHFRQTVADQARPLYAAA